MPIAKAKPSRRGENLVNHVIQSSNKRVNVFAIKGRCKGRVQSTKNSMHHGVGLLFKRLDRRQMLTSYSAVLYCQCICLRRGRQKVGHLIKVIEILGFTREN